MVLPNWGLQFCTVLLKIRFIRQLLLKWWLWTLLQKDKKIGRDIWDVCRFKLNCKICTVSLFIGNLAFGQLGTICIYAVWYMMLGKCKRLSPHRPYIVHNPQESMSVSPIFTAQNNLYNINMSLSPSNLYHFVVDYGVHEDIWGSQNWEILIIIHVCVSTSL